MKIEIVLEWLVWSIAFFIFISFVSNMRKEAKKSMPIHENIILQAILFFICLVIFLFNHWNKFHLLWLFPLSFIASFIIVFILMRIPIISSLIRIFIKLFASIFLFGIKTQIIGAPFTK